MPELLRDVIEDIRKKLKSNAYQNEEHVRLSLVARIVQALGWDIWNPGEVNAEYKATANEDNTKVDLTLLTSPGAAAAFIEIKGVGRLSPNLNSVETQMKGYLRNYSAPFCVLTDGQHWFFYYVFANRIEFADKCFKKLNLLSDDLDDLELVFDNYLSKENHLNGHAKVDADSELAMTDRERRIRECINEARTRAEKSPFTTPAALLKLIVEERHGFEPNDAEVLRAFEIPPQPPPLIKHPDEPKPPHPPVDSNKLRGGASGFGSTKLRGFKFRGIYYPVRNWANLLPELSVIMAKQVTDFDRVLGLQGRTRAYYDRSDKEMRNGKMIKGTNYYVESHGDPNELARRAHLLLKTFNISEDELMFDAHKR